jgi:hypothetical protein
MNTAPAVPRTSTTIPVPTNFRAFRSSTSPLSPFDVLLRFLAREVGKPDLQFADVTLSESAYGQLHFQTRAWLDDRDQLDRLPEVTRHGITSPLIGRMAPLNCAVVMIGGDS